MNYYLKFKKKLFRKAVSMFLALVMLLQGVGGLFTTYKQIALGLGALASFEAIANDGITDMDYNQFFKSSSEMGFNGLFDTAKVEQQKALQGSIDHSNKQGVESKGLEVLETMKSEGAESYEILSSTYHADKQAGSFDEALAGIKTFDTNYTPENIFTSNQGGCEDIVQTNIIENSITRTEYKYCSKSSPLDLKVQQCEISRQFDVARVLVNYEQPGLSETPIGLSYSHGFVNAEGVEVAKSESDVTVKSSSTSFVFNVENKDLLGTIQIPQIDFPGELRILLNGQTVFQGGGVEFGCDLVGSTCRSESGSVNSASPINIVPYLVNGVNNVSLEMRSIFNSANLELTLSYPKSPILVETKQDSPVGCSSPATSGVYNGQSVPIYNLDASGDVLSSGSAPYFQCSDSSNTMLGNGSALAVNNDNFPGKISSLYPGSDPSSICYKAYSSQALYLGGVVACSASDCPDEIRGKTYAQIAQQSSVNNQCAELEAAPVCKESKRICTEESGGVCSEWEVEYACSVEEQFESVTQNTSEDCGIPVCDKYGNCTTSRQNATSDFAAVASQLSVFQMARGDLDPNIDEGTLKIFKGEDSECRSMQLYGLGNNCCKGISGVGPIGLVTTLYKVSKNEWVATKYNQALSSLGDTAIGGDFKSGYEALSDGIANSWDAVSAPFQDAYASIFEQTASVATDTMASGGSSLVSSGSGSFFSDVAGSVSSFLDDIMIEIYQSIYDNLGHEIGSKLFEVVGGNGGFVTGLSSGFATALSVIGMIYTFYTLAKLIINMITQCDRSEYATQVKAKQQNCIYQGQRCSDKDFFGNCVEKTRYYCCFKSPLARIVSQQGSRQLGKDACSGFTHTQFSKLDFSKIDLSEWTGYLKKSGVIPSADSAKKMLDDKFLQANAAKSLNLDDYSLSSERVKAKVTKEGVSGTQQGVKNDLYVNRSGLSAEGVERKATVVYDEMPEVKDWHDVLMVESKYDAKKKTPKIFSYKFPEKAGYRLVYSSKRPSGYPAEPSTSTSLDWDDYGGPVYSNYDHHGSCKDISKDIYRLKSAGEVFTLGGYVQDNGDYSFMCDDNHNWQCGVTGEEWVCQYDVKIYKRVLK
jgi:hypothetical protein